MHDYQLERLNTRSFEQLIQALGTEIIGPQLMIFGDGPDGGREATFDGATKYPPTEKSWSGYGMVQAKFRQQPDSAAKKNADWAIQQLKLEFAKLKPRPKRKQNFPSHDRVCPEYYIFATNLALSPVARTGGKDRVRAVLDGFKKSHGLKDYAIWDGDQIRRFLDAQPGIRTTYTAWLLPGDVLAEMMKALQLEKTHFPSTIRRYLESELLDDQFARLGQGGYTDAKNIPLSYVFVDLPVDLPADVPLSREATPPRFPQGSANADEGEGEKARQGVPSTFLGLLFEEGRQVLKPSAMHRQVPREVRGKHQDGRVVLIGGEHSAVIPSTAHRDWRVYQAVSAFARKPTKANLAEQLTTISQIHPDAASSQMLWIYPWQIAICLRARNAGRPWNEIISCVEAGNIGAEGDWIRWEEQNKAGIRLSQFRFADGLSISDELQGALLRESRWMFSTEGKRVLQFADALSDALVLWPEIKSAKPLVDLCCFGLCRRGIDLAAGSQVIARFVNTCSEQKVALTTPVLAGVLFGSLSIGDKRNLLAKAGGCSIQPGWLDEWERRAPEANRLLDAIIGELLACDEWWNVLRALSFLPPLDALQQIPETFFEQLRLKSEAFSTAASSLRLNSLGWKACESGEVVREALALKEVYPDHMWRVFEFIDSGGKSGPEAFMVELIKQRPLDFGPQLPKRATELLVKLLERRPAISTLPDPAIRQAR